jgi:NhaA family Na+:H+ antiporter
MATDTAFAVALVVMLGRRVPVESEPALRALDAIHDRLESPADRMLRAIEPWSSYLVLPVFALANAGVAISTAAFAGREALLGAIGLGLIVGKPLGFLVFPALAMWLRMATKPVAYSWRQLLGAGALAGVGFTMSLFIAGQAFPVADDFAAAKIVVLAASIVSAIVGVAILWRPQGKGGNAVHAEVTAAEHTAVEEPAPARASAR